MKLATWTRDQIARRAAQRPPGWTERLMALAVHETAEGVTFDAHDPRFRAMREEFRAAPRDRVEAPSLGILVHGPASTELAFTDGQRAPKPPCTGACPGTILMSILKAWGIHATAECPCKAMAAQMDEWGPDGCERHTDEIVTVMADEATRRKLPIPFKETAARALVRKAIRLSRKAAIQNPQPLEGV